MSNNSQKKKKAVKLGDGKKFETFDPSNESLTQATGKNSPLIHKQHLPCKISVNFHQNLDTNKSFYADSQIEYWCRRCNKWLKINKYK